MCWRSVLRLWLQMLKAIRLVESCLRENFRELFDTTLPRFDVMAALHAATEGIWMSELSQHLVVSNRNVTGEVGRLVKDRLVERRAVESDPRAGTVRLTREGQLRIAEVSTTRLEWINTLFEQVTEADAACGSSNMLDIRSTR